MTPVLLYFQGRRRNTVYYASHQTYTMCRQAIEFMYIEKFRSESLTESASTLLRSSARSS